MHILLDQVNISDKFEQSAYLKDLIENRQGNIKGRSLFLPLANRNCLQAFIPEYLCGCYFSFNVDKDKNPMIQKGTEFMINHINNNLLKDFQDICMQLSLSRIIDAQIYKNYKNKFSVIFETAPNNASFDGTLVLKEDGKFEIIGRLVRINTYGLSAGCIKKYNLKNYCYCYDFHNQQFSTSTTSTTTKTKTSTSTSAKITNTSTVSLKK